MRFDTTIVDNKPKSGVTKITAINALRMNSYSNNIITAQILSALKIFSSRGGILTAMKKILLVVVALTILFFVTSPTKIFIGTEHETVAVVDADENFSLTINFIHSVQKTPVVEELIFKDGEFILLRTKYKSQGVGLPFDEADGKFYRDGEWFIFDEMNRRFKNLELRTGKGTQLKIIVNGREHELYKKFPLGTKIIVKSF